MAEVDMQQKCIGTIYQTFVNCHTLYEIGQKYLQSQ